MHPHTGIGRGEIAIINFDTGVVVPEPDVWYGYLDDRDESITFTQPTIMEVFRILERYVQAAPVATIQECLYHVLPGSDLIRSAGMIAVIGTKKDVIHVLCSVREIVAIVQQGLDGVLDLVSDHEQGLHAKRWSVLNFFAPEKIC